MMFPPPKGHWFSKGILVTLATTIFGLSLIANIYLLGWIGLSGGEVGPVVESTIKAGSKDKIAVIPVRGIIDDQTAMLMDAFLRKAEEDKDVRAVVLEVDSPGGSVGASDQIHHRIEQFKSEHGMKVVVSMSDLAASGGYYISADADRIFAQPTTLTGSIGVILFNLNFSELAKKYGVTDASQVAPAGGFKDAGSSLRPPSERDRMYWQSLIDQAFVQFTGIVKSGRKSKLKGPESDIFNGKVFTAAEAQKNGLVDEIGYLEQACNWAATQVGIGNPTIVRYHRRPSFLEKMMAQSDVRPQASGGVNVTLDARMIDELTTPRLQYLWKGQ